MPPGSGRWLQIVTILGGKLIGSYLDHTNSAATPNSVHVKTSMKYDHAGRLLEVWKTINDDDSKKALIVKNEYNMNWVSF